MNRENTLAFYAPDKVDEILRREKEEKDKFFVMIEKLKSLREFDPDAYDELVEAMLYIRGDKNSKLIYSCNLFAEYGLMENEAVKDVLERQERILAIARSNKDIDTLLNAMNHIEGR